MPARRDPGRRPLQPFAFEDRQGRSSIGAILARPTPAGHESLHSHAVGKITYRRERLTGYESPTLVINRTFLAPARFGAREFECKHSRGLSVHTDASARPDGLTL